MATRFYASQYTVEALKAMADAKSPAEVSKDYDVFVRQMDRRPQTPVSRENLDMSVAGSINDSASRRTIPRHTDSSHKYRISERPVKDTAEINDLVKKISDMISLIDEKEKRMAPFGPLPYKPLNSKHRKSIDDLVIDGNEILDDLKQTKTHPYVHPQTEKLREHELKSVLLDLKLRLLQKLPPDERQRHDVAERERLKKQMADVEGRIVEIIGDLERNEQLRDRLTEAKEREARERAAREAAERDRMSRQW